MADTASNDGIGTPEQGFVCRGGRMLNEETYENFWELFGSIPSLRQPGHSVTEEILEFDHAHPTCAKARLVDKDGNAVTDYTLDDEGNVVDTQGVVVVKAADITAYEKSEEKDAENKTDASEADTQKPEDAAKPDGEKKSDTQKTDAKVDNTKKDETNQQALPQGHK